MNFKGEKYFTEELSRRDIGDPGLLAAELSFQDYVCLVFSNSLLEEGLLDARQILKHTWFKLGRVKVLDRVPQVFAALEEDAADHSEAIRLCKEQWDGQEIMQDYRDHQEECLELQETLHGMGIDDMSGVLSHYEGGEAVEPSNGTGNDEAGDLPTEGNDDTGSHAGDASADTLHSDGHKDETAGRKDAGHPSSESYQDDLDGAGKQDDGPTGSVNSSIEASPSSPSKIPASAAGIPIDDAGHQNDSDHIDFPVPTGSDSDTNERSLPSSPPPWKLKYGLKGNPNDADYDSDDCVMEEKDIDRACCTGLYGWAIHWVKVPLRRNAWAWGFHITSVSNMANIVRRSTGIKSDGEDMDVYNALTRIIGHYGFTKVPEMERTWRHNQFVRGDEEKASKMKPKKKKK
ncbi:MAG: hypothetical protein SGARI_000575 [Bacillariaceae sp.]